MDFVSTVPRRSKNFDRSEIDILLKIVNKHKNILECKQTDKASIQVKHKLWLCIEDEFNEQSKLLFRDWRTLKGKYENLKKANKLLMTGKPNHSFEKIDLNGLYEKSNVGLSLVPDVSVEGVTFDFENSSDDESDCLNTTNLNSQISGSTFVLVPQNVPEDDKPIHEIETSLNSHKVRKEANKTLKSTNYKISKTDSVSLKKQEINSLRKAKQELLRLKQLSEQKAEHQLRIKCIDEEHQLKLQLLKIQVKSAELEFETKSQHLIEQKTEHLLKIKIIEEEHEQKLKLLKLQVKSAELEYEKKSQQLKKDERSVQNKIIFPS